MDNNRNSEVFLTETVVTGTGAIVSLVQNLSENRFCRSLFTLPMKLILANKMLVYLSISIVNSCSKGVEGLLRFRAKGVYDSQAF